MMDVSAQYTGLERDASVLDRLWSPIRVGELQLANRLGMASMHSNLGNEVGGTTERLLRYFEARARGGPALVMLEHLIVVWPVGKNHARCLSIADDRFLPGLHDVVELLHSYGVAAGAQLDHAGGQTQILSTEGVHPVGPSPVSVRRDLPPPRPLARSELAGVVEAFAQAADRAVRVGFDIVEIHAGHAYLLGQFLSPRTNQRDDDYGGSLSNRTRLLRDVCAQVRATVGPRPVVSCRLNIDDYEEGGWRVEDTAALLPMLADIGVNMISFTAGSNNSRTYPSLGQPWPARPDVERVRSAWAGCVAAAGGLDPATAAEAIERGTIDLALMGRPFLADPLWPAKLRDRATEPIRPCIYCNACLNAIRQPVSISCAVNPSTGRELLERPSLYARRLQRVAVIGAGPCGLEAAWAAAMLGHSVTLFERRNELGGQVSLAVRSRLWRPFNALLHFYDTELRRLDVKLYLGHEVTPEDISSDDYEVVCLCTGAREGPLPMAAGLPGVTYSWTAIAGQIPLGQRVVVVGASPSAAAAASVCADRGSEVDLVCDGRPLLAEVERTRRLDMLRALEAHGVAIHQEPVEAISDGFVLLRSSQVDQRERLPFDALVVSGPIVAAQTPVITRGVEMLHGGDGAGGRGLEAAIGAGRSMATRIGLGPLLRPAW